MSAELVVLDASAAVELLLATDDGQQIDHRLRSGAGLVAPAHFDAEVLSALGRLCRSGQIPATVVGDALEDLADLPIQRIDLPPLLAEAWALRHNVSGRDGLYVAIARRAEATLVTTDGRLARAVERHHLSEVWTPS